MTKKEVINFGLLGAGARGSYFARTLTGISDRIRLAKVYDPNPAATARLVKDGVAIAGAAVCGSEQEVINDPALDWLLIFSPNSQHCRQCVEALNRGKHVFLEKPPGTSIDENLAIAEAYGASGRMLVLGFVLRYTPLWRRARDLVASGAVGRIISISAEENLSAPHGAHIMMGWRRFSEISGSHLLEKCCHLFDLLNWFIQDLPAAGASFGNRRLFTPENQSLREKYRDADGKSPFDGWSHANDDQPCPFRSDKTVVDNQVALLEYRHGVTVSFQTTLANALPEKRFYISGTEGTMIVDYTGGAIKYGKYGAAPQVLPVDMNAGHGGGDQLLLADLVQAMTEERRPEFEGIQGLIGAITALALEQARQTGTIVHLEPYWRQLGW